MIGFPKAKGTYRCDIWVNEESSKDNEESYGRWGCNGSYMKC